MKLNAPDDYRWTDGDVRFEKRDSWFDGLMVGWTTAAAVVLIATGYLR